MTQIKPILIAISLAFALMVIAIVSSANAQGFQTVTITNQPNTKANAYEPSVAVTVWRDAAERGDSSAQFMPGLYNTMPKGRICRRTSSKPMSGSNYPPQTTH
jgi:hypothetical protein